MIVPILISNRIDKLAFIDESYEDGIEKNNIRTQISYIHTQKLLILWTFKKQISKIKQENTIIKHIKNRICHFLWDFQPRYDGMEKPQLKAECTHK